MRKILLVDDDIVILELYGEALADSGFEVTTATDGVMAVEKFQVTRPDLVILDMNMPKLPGTEVLKFIRAQAETASTPVAVFTSAFMDEMAQAAIEIGVQQTIIKAECTPRKLIKSAEALLSGTPPPVIKSPRATPAPAIMMPLELPTEAVPVGEASRAREEFVKEAPVMMAELRDLYQTFRKSPDLAARESRLAAFYRQVQYVTAISGLASFRDISLLSSIFEAMLFELQHTPDRINPSSLRTIAVTLDFMAELFARLRDGLPDEAPLTGNVLVVDDDKVTNHVAVLALQRAHLQTRGVENPLMALKLLEETRYDLILLDIEMPEMKGFDVCKKLRLLPGYEKTPVIYVTVHTDFASRAQSILSGGNDLIAKPFFPIELAVKAVTHLIKGRLPVVAPAKTAEVE